MPSTSLIIGMYVSSATADTNVVTGLMIEQGLTSNRTRFLQVIWPNQQCQSTKGSQLVFQISLESHQDHSTMLQ